MPFRYRFAAAAWQTWATKPRQRMMNPFRYRCMSSSCVSAAGSFLDANRLQAGICEGMNSLGHGIKAPQAETFYLGYRN
ncbi:hypothetical protein M5X11_03410 [Paenibacillus alginolyticus]|uniref:Uncharacterized protein n=1 Tax=Paenibacillus alginolyticus TaxID=59839 RepID=A0ABT4GCL1_9BACL|nr:hypothetical protein [Paenibacillus alginolyticus]MCY9664030.1 hypothetical protein [Paenibacillus alginolyticus]MCY9693930.1 hypothetical protein [Paenibacillus alginolyticus]MEC0146851.1 hypothetical protein [Paenibacillus alginolyticus]